MNSLHSCASANFKIDDNSADIDSTCINERICKELNTALSDSSGHPIIADTIDLMERSIGNENIWVDNERISHYFHKSVESIKQDMDSYKDSAVNCLSRLEPTFKKVEVLIHDSLKNMDSWKESLEDSAQTAIKENINANIITQKLKTIEFELANRIKLVDFTTTVLDQITVDAEQIKVIENGALDEEYLNVLQKLFKKQTFTIQPGVSEYAISKETQKILDSAIKCAMHRIFNFITERIIAMVEPNTNFRILQQSLLPLSLHLKQLSLHDEGLSKKLSAIYISEMTKLVNNLLLASINRLIKKTDYKSKERRFRILQDQNKFISRIVPSFASRQFFRNDSNIDSTAASESPITDRIIVFQPAKWNDWLENERTNTKKLLPEWTCKLMLEIMSGNAMAEKSFITAFFDYDHEANSKSITKTLYYKPCISLIQEFLKENLFKSNDLIALVLCYELMIEAKDNFNQWCQSPIKEYDALLEAINDTMQKRFSWLSEIIINCKLPSNGSNGSNSQPFYISIEIYNELSNCVNISAKSDGNISDLVNSLYDTFLRRIMNHIDVNIDVTLIDWNYFYAAMNAIEAAQYFKEETDKEESERVFSGIRTNISIYKWIERCCEKIAQFLVNDQFHKDIWLQSNEVNYDGIERVKNNYTERLAKLNSIIVESLRSVNIKKLIFKLILRSIVKEIGECDQHLIQLDKKHLSFGTVFKSKVLEYLQIIGWII